MARRELGMMDGKESGLSLDVTAIVVSYNSEERIGAAVTAHHDALAHLEHEVIVIDNASGDASVERASDAVVSGRVIANEKNLGYGKAANQGIAAARGKTCLILNDDARLEPAAIDRLLDVLFADPETALVGPRIVDENGDSMPSARVTYPGLAEEWERLKDLLGGHNRNNLYPATGEPMEVAWLVAACILGKTETLRSIGGFNPAFFLYAEDIDLARRLTSRGFRVMTVPDAVCVHTGSVSTGKAFGRRQSINRRADSRDIYYRIWEPRLIRSLVHIRRAIGLANQPDRLLHHFPRIFWDGASMPQHRVVAPLEPLAISDGDSEGVR